MRIKFSKPTLYILLVIAVATLVVIGLLFSVRAALIKALIRSLNDTVLQIIKPSSTSVSPLDISSWKTYRNEKYGFEVKYPPDFTKTEPPPSLLVDAPSELFSVISLQHPDDFPGFPGSFIISIYNNRAGLSIDDWFSAFRKNLIFQNAGDIVAASSTLGMLPARMFSSESATKLGVYVSKDRNIYGLELLAYTPHSSYSLIFEKIRESFKFTN